MAFGHESLDVYNLSLDYAAWAIEFATSLKRPGSALRDQWIRACSSIPLNTAEGNGKVTEADRRKFFEIARGSTLECAAIQDVLVVSHQLDPELSTQWKQSLERIVSMLTGLGGRGYVVKEEEVSYGTETSCFDSDPDFDSDSGSPEAEGSSA
jgi:four helix bundle protein